MTKLFHVEHKNKTLFYKGFFLFFVFSILVSCKTQRELIDVSDYILLDNGKQVPGKEKGLTAFLFQNNPKKKSFNQFLVEKYGLGTYQDIEYWVTIDGIKFKVFLYENAELEKYFVTNDFVASNVVPDASVVGSKVKFLAISVIDSYNDDCLADTSLFKNIVIKYLKDLKEEYNNSI